MQIERQRAKSKGAPISGPAGVNFVAGELLRLGYIALSTVRNTKGVDLLVSDVSSLRTVYIQVKTNKDKLDFWLTGQPKQDKNLFYVFVNLLSHKKFERPEYYIVPSKDVNRKFQDLQKRKEYENLTNQEKEKIAEFIKDGKHAGRITDELNVKVGAVRKIAREKGLKIKSDRGKGEHFTFCFSIRNKDESKYKDRWDLLFP